MLWWLLACAVDKDIGLGDTALVADTTPIATTGDTAGTTLPTTTPATGDTGCSDPPEASDDGWAVVEDGVLEVDAPGVLQNDTYACALEARLVDGPTNGVLELGPDGGLAYTPDADFNGSDAFTYEAVHADQATVATVTLEVLPTNDPPVAVNDAYEVRAGETLRVPADRGVLANDSDPDGDELEARIDPAGIPEHGVWTFLPDGSIEYTADPDYEGVERIAYKAFDGLAESDLAQATITVRR